MDPCQPPWAVTGQIPVVGIFIRSMTFAFVSQGIPKNEELHPNDQLSQQGGLKIIIRGEKVSKGSKPLNSNMQGLIIDRFYK